MQASASEVIYKAMDQDQPSLEAVRQRRKQIAAEDAQLARIEEGLVQAAQAWVAYMAHHSLVPPPSLIGGATTVEAQKKRAGASVYAPGKPPTKGALILEALSEPRPLWQEAHEVRDYVAKQTGKPVKMTSISPKLSDLKKEGVLVRDDMRVALASRAKTEERSLLENEPPAGEPANGSETGVFA